MDQQALIEEDKKYKNIDLSTSNKTSSINNELKIVSSIKRIAGKKDEVNKIFDDVQKASSKELQEKLEIAHEELINLYYDMELSILSQGNISLIMGEKLHMLKAIICLCKIQLCLPGLNTVSFSIAFTEEYSQLLERTDKAIESVKGRIDRLKIIEGTDSLKSVLEKNLLTLNMLRMHYITALGLPEIN